MNLAIKEGSIPKILTSLSLEAKDDNLGPLEFMVVCQSDKESLESLASRALKLVIHTLEKRRCTKMMSGQKENPQKSTLYDITPAGQDAGLSKAVEIYAGSLSGFSVPSVVIYRIMNKEKEPFVHLFGAIPNTPPPH